MRTVWSDENRTQKYLDIEVALARVQARLGIIPNEAVDLLAENEQVTKHLNRSELAKLCDPSNYLGQSGVMVDRVLASVNTKSSTNHDAMPRDS